MKGILRRPLTLSLAIGTIVFLIVTGAQRFGLLQRWELMAYDALIRARHQPGGSDGRIVIIGITEKDLMRFDYPLSDERLASLVETVNAGAPRAIGLDIFRDLSEPRSGAGAARLASVLQKTENLIAIFKLPDSNGPGIPAPAALAGETDRLASNEFPVDQNVVRRGFLFPEPSTSFALSLAMLYLQVDGIALDQADPNHPDLLRLGKTTLRPFRPNDGGYVGADARGYQLLLDFKGPDHFTTYSYGDVAEGRVPPDAMRDKIVLIATTAETVKDELATPLTVNCRGVVLHAQIINQLLRLALSGDSLCKVWPEWLEILWSLGWACGGALVGVLLLRCTKRASIYFAIALAILYWLSRTAFFNDWWIPPVAPTLSFVLSAVCSLGLVSFVERRERNELMRLFSLHVSGKVAEALWADREKFLDGNRPRSQKLSATVLFTDYVGFSTISEHMEPGAVMDWLNTGMESLSRHVEDHDGMINKYMGDAIMAVFGAPVARTTDSEVAADARNAVRCALAMSGTIEELNKRWAQQGLPTVGMRIGIHTGFVVAGCIGSSTRLEFTVTGDTVNTAARLESTKKDEIPPPPGRQCRILVSEATHALLGGLFDDEYVGEEVLKGRAGKVKVYRVLLERNADPFKEQAQKSQ